MVLFIGMLIMYMIGVNIYLSMCLIDNGVFIMFGSVLRLVLIRNKSVNVVISMVMILVRILRLFDVFVVNVFMVDLYLKFGLCVCSLELMVFGIIIKVSVMVVGVVIRDVVSNCLSVFGRMFFRNML